MCVEWEVRDGDNFVRLSFDGVDNPELTVDTKDHGGNDVDFDFPEFDTWKVGWQLYQGGQSPNQYDIWIDDLIFDDARIGRD